MRAQLFKLDAVFCFRDGDKCIDYNFLIICTQGLQPVGLKKFRVRINQRTAIAQ
jgi:hypothetical protein